LPRSVRGGQQKIFVNILLTKLARTLRFPRIDEL